MWLKLALLIVQGHHGLASIGQTYRDLLPFQLICIKCMQWLSILQHDIVGNIDNVVNWTNTSSHQAIA
ncbi:hypothetical protein D1872_260450 [compost metagenome]